MTSYPAHMTLYDDITDVMYFKLADARFTSEFEVAPGIHVLYAYEGGTLDEVVAVEIEYFRERFGDSVSDIVIPARTPFTVTF